MNLVKVLWKEHSRTTCGQIVAYIGTDKKKFGQLIDIFFNNNYRLSQRASWPLSFCVEQHPALVKPHSRKLISTVLANLVEKQPGLKSELRIIIEDELPYGSAGFLSRGKKILKKLKA
jgi:hypothetical protein